jgi:sugar-specific transcriptional regulator TrmB
MNRCHARASRPRCESSGYASKDDPRTKLTELFQNLGLRPNERKLLAALVLSHDEAGADELSRMTGIRHDEVYENMTNLGSKGLVSCSFANHKRFVAASISDIVDNLVTVENDELRSVKDKSIHYQKILEEVKAKDAGNPHSKADSRMRIMAGRQRVESRLAEMAARCKNRFKLVITEEGFRHLAHTSLLPAIDDLSARKIVTEIVVPSSKVASCIQQRDGIDLVIAKMSAGSVSFAIADNSEMLVIPAGNVAKMYGIFSTKQSFIASFAAYLNQIETISKQDPIDSAE